jgi:hypothetical protein
LGLRVEGLGFRVQGLGIRVEGAGCRVSPLARGSGLDLQRRDLEPDLFRCLPITEKEN